MSYSFGPEQEKGVNRVAEFSDIEPCPALNVLRQGQQERYAVPVRRGLK